MPTSASRHASSACLPRGRDQLALPAPRQAARFEVAVAVEGDRDAAQRRRVVPLQRPHLAVHPDGDRRQFVAGQRDRFDAAVEGDEEIALRGQLGAGEASPWRRRAPARSRSGRWPCPAPPRNPLIPPPNDSRGAGFRADSAQSPTASASRSTCSSVGAAGEEGELVAAGLAVGLDVAAGRPRRRSRRRR